MVILELIIAGYACALFLNVTLNLLFLPKIIYRPLSHFPKVSVLIPARNEEANLKKNLPLWLDQKYPELEILVLNDNSEDSTSEVIRKFNPKVRYLEGAPLPAGWIGKNWACHQLSQQASGHIFLFVDADVSPNQDAILRTVATMQTYELAAFSSFLKQDFSHWSSLAVIPWALQFPVLAWPPHFLNRFKHFSSLVMGNGQWFSLLATAYRRVGGHEAVRGSVIEDMSLAKLLFRNNISYSFFLAPDLATVTMYSNWHSLREGLTKNLAFILGGNLTGNFIFLALYFGVIGSLFIKWGILFICLAFYLVQRAFHQSLINPLNYLIGLFVTPYLLLRSMIEKSRSRIFWKGREY